jgi:hypothetical protein
MIRNIITAAILFAALLSMTSLAQIANAIDPDLKLDISIYEDSLIATSYPFAWTPDLSQHERISKLYESLLLPSVVGSSGFSSSETTQQRLISFDIYQGDGLNDLRQESKHHNSLTLPDEDTEAYGVSVKQRF